MTIFGTFLRARDGLAWSGGMVRLLGELGVSPEGARAALNRLAIRGLIARTKRGREVFYSLTPKTHDLMEVGNSRIDGFGEAIDDDDATWTVLWHAMPDDMRAERTMLSRRLRYIGFGSVQDATWLAPHDRELEVLSLLRELDVERHAWMMIGRPTKALTSDSVLAEAWDLEGVQTRYRKFVHDFGPYRRAQEQARLAPSAAFAICTIATHEFRQFPFLDPELHDRFMPGPAVRPAVIDIYRRLREGLLPPAEQYFFEVVNS